MPLRVHDLLPVAAAFVGTLALTPLVRALARRWGMVARPKADRWHKKPTALLGGVAIFVALAAVELALVPLTPQALVVLGAAAFLFLVGLVDDVLNLKPYQKLSGQLVGAMPVIYSGLVLPWTGSPAVNTAVTVLWLVGITNAVNLLDNMDGLSAGVALIAATFLGANFAANGQATDALTMAVFAAALLGFLVYNSHPATIFMGDCGSLFIGFFLAGSALLHPVGGRSRSLLPVVAVPVLILFIPIFDTVFVTLLRKLAGRPASQGGRDHTSHRLVALGLSERRAVWMLYGFAASSGTLALLVRGLKLDVSLALIAAFSILLTLVGVHLAGVKVYDAREAGAAAEKPLVSFLVDLSYKRRVFEVMLDVLLITLSYYTSYALIHGPLDEARARNLFLETLPVLVTIKIAVFLATGVYRGLWRYVSLDSLVTFAKAVAASSAVSMLALVFAFRFAGYSRVVFVLDGLILLCLLAGSRMAFRLLRMQIPAPATRSARRVLIYGAGDAGELLVRELLNNPTCGRKPVGFADDDPRKKGKVIHGLCVLGGNGSLPSICERLGVEEVVISTNRISDARVSEILRECQDIGIELNRMRIQIERIDVVATEGEKGREVLSGYAQFGPAIISHPA
jgi:UDP-GlcNAc:undecaprenyl-phosphate/decaprenyl-phosphate GlcNAc-1-phosphate transferase